MIVGYGVDLCSVLRMQRLASDNLFLSKVFHPGELLACAGPKRAWSLAARWAAREAFAKATGLGMAKLGFKGVEVVSDGGAPRLKAHSSAALQALQGRRVWLSLSHDGEFAFAGVILEEL